MLSYLLDVFFGYVLARNVRNVGIIVLFALFLGVGTAIVANMLIAAWWSSAAVEFRTQEVISRVVVGAFLHPIVIIGAALFERHRIAKNGRLAGTADVGAAVASAPQANVESGTKVCPFCAETIKAAAIVCRYCGRDLPEAPPTAALVSRAVTEQEPPAETVLENAPTPAEPAKTYEMSAALACFIVIAAFAALVFVAWLVS